MMNVLKLASNVFPVIPVKTGIQFSLNFSWIPASAGMTKLKAIGRYIRNNATSVGMAFMVAQSALASPLNTQFFTTQNTPVYVVKTTRLPMVLVNTTFRAGAAYDGAKPGLAVLTGSLMDQGSGESSANQLADTLADNGAGVDIDVTQDAATLGLQAVMIHHSFLPAFKAYLSMLHSPSFSLSAFNRLKAQQLQSIQYQSRLPGAIASHALMKSMYGEGAYSWPVIGEKSAVESISRQDVVNFHHQYYGANNAVISIVGDVSNNLAHSIASGIVSNLNSGTLQNLPAISSAVRNKKVQGSFKQTTIMFGVPAIAAGDSRMYSAVVGNWILGGGQTSRLYHQVRTENALAYSASSRFSPRLSQGPFVMKAQTKNSDAGNTKLIMQGILESYLNKGPTASELAKAKRHILGAYQLKFNSNAAIERSLTQMAFYRLPLDYFAKYPHHIRQVTQASVKKVMNELIQQNQLSTVEVGGND